jgi:hypothetical protein
MNITKLTLQGDQLLEQHRFYSQTLGLDARLSDTRLEVRVGSSLLEFVQDEGFTGRYHVAFNIPRNQFRPATQWLETRVSLVADKTGETRFHTDEWNADNVYFQDPNGNILELIARHELDNASDQPFNSDSLLEISEIGLAARGALELVDWFSKTLGIGTYKSFGDHFAPIGDARGLVIAVRAGRIWFPDTGISAEALPTELTIHGTRLETHAIPGLPYGIHVTP